MKKKLLLISVLLLLFSSCRKDESEEKENLIVGTWKWTKVMVVSGKDNSTILTDPILPSDCKSNNRYTYDLNLRYTYTEFQEISGICKLFKTYNTEYSFDQKTKILTIKSDGANNATVLELYTLTENEMAMIQDENQDYDNDGIKDKFLTVFNK